ncbi:MAG: DUF3105 domain-containing protein [Actinomycetota bacterium]
MSRLRLLPALVVAATLVACGDGGSVSASCEEVVTEELDPGWTVHLLPSAEEPEYLTDPPTSGAHFAAEPVSGIADGPLDRPIQVTILEVGGVLFQYDPDELDDADVGRLERLADEAVVVAPGVDLPSPVVATAWVTKQTCDGVDLDTLTRFVEEQGGSGPGVEQ